MKRLQNLSDLFAQAALIARNNGHAMREYALAAKGFAYWEAYSIWSAHYGQPIVDDLYWV